MAGVSVSTVSRALHNHPDIGEAVKQKVRAVADALHYHPNTQAVNFRQRRSRLIGLIIPEISMFFIPSIIRGVSSVLEANGYQVMVLPSQESADKEKELVRRCLDNSVEGLLVSLSHETHEMDHLLQAAQLDIPVVLFDKTQDRAGFDRVMIDDRQAAAGCVRYLIDAGCRRIAGVFGNTRMDISRNREDGFRQALAQFDLQPAAPILYADSSAAAEVVCLAHLADQRLDGLFAMSDETLVGAMAALRKLHVPVPDTCRVVCISDGMVPNIFNPPVPYLLHNGFEVGTRAATRLLERIADPKLGMSTQQILVPTIFNA